jgi:phage anti-repressor protein
MDLPIYTSKKGTKVVRATELHLALQLPDHHYATNIRRWLQDLYSFVDGIRRPQGMRDYARRKEQPSALLEDYYLSVELAKLICLRTRSKVRHKYANLLHRHEVRTPTLPQFGPQDVLNFIDLVKAMSLVSCQQAAETAHLEAYRQLNNGSAEYWNRYRGELIGYRKEDLIRKLRAHGQEAARSMSLRELLQRLDSSELIRLALIDHYLGQGFAREYSLHIGEMGKRLAQEMQLATVDDTQNGSLFAPEVNPEMLRAIRGHSAAA